LPENLQALWAGPPYMERATCPHAPPSDTCSPNQEHPYDQQNYFSMLRHTGIDCHEPVLIGRPQSGQMARHEPHMSAAYGHLEQAKAELERAAPNKGGHRERAMELVDQAMQEVMRGEDYDQNRPR